MLDFGEHSEESLEQCGKTWTREAIAMARAKLDELERIQDELEVEA